MNFKVTLSGYAYSREEKEKLENKGFKFKEMANGTFIVDIFSKEEGDEVTLEINTLEELMELLDHDNSGNSQELIVSKDRISIGYL